MYKYHHMERPAFEKVKVTAESELPALPAKEELLKNPAKEAFDAKMVKIDGQIAEARARKEELHAKRREVIDGGKMSGSTLTYREALTKEIELLRSDNKEKQRLQAQMKGVQEELDVLEAEKNALQKSMHSEFRTAEQVQAAIKNLEYRHKTCTFNSATEENKVIKEMEQLRASIPKANRYSEIRPLTAELVGKKQAIWGELKAVKKVVEGKQARIEKLRKEMEVVKEGQTDVKEQADRITADIDKQQTRISELFAAKDAARDEYYKAKFDYEVQRDYIYHVNGLQARQEALRSREANKAEAEQLRRQMIKDLPHPYRKEIETCQHLVNYCHQLKRKAGLEQDSETLARATQQALLTEANQQKVAQKLTDGQLQESSGTRDEQNFTVIGGGKGKKGKKQKKVEYEDVFALDVVIIQKFGMLQVSPPVRLEDLDPKIDELAKKEAWFQDNGKDKLAEQIKDLESQALREAEEMQQELEKEQQLEPEYEAPARGRAGRGGRGRGRGGMRGGRGRGDRDRP